jgi:hypothetical protein
VWQWLDKSRTETLIKKKVSIRLRVTVRVRVGISVRVRVKLGLRLWQKVRRVKNGNSDEEKGFCCFC